MDKRSNLFFGENESCLKPLEEMPWESQQYFFFTFLHDDDLSERFRNMEIIGAIDLYIKSMFFLGKPMYLSFVGTVHCCAQDLYATTAR